jgi:predicted dehydrogenase
MLPNLSKTSASLRTIVSSGGVSAEKMANKFDFDRSSTDVDEVFADESCDAVVITTRHDSHASLTVRALEAGQAVFVEKPLAVTNDQLDEVIAAWEAAPSPLVMVGFNRRFAPQVVRIKQLVDAVEEPCSFVMTVNAGIIPGDSWVHDPHSGGGRIVGEGCHFIDLLRFLAGSPITACHAAPLGRVGGLQITEDKTSITLTFANGAVGTVHYLGNGSKAFPKERLEIFAAGRVLQLGDFKTLQAWSWPGFRKSNLRKQD